MILILASHAWVHFYCTQFCQDQRKREEVSHSQYKVQLVSFNILKHGRCTLQSCNTIVFLWPHGSLRLWERRLLRSVLQYFGMGLNMSKHVETYDAGKQFWEMVSTRLSISPRFLPIDVVNRKKCGNWSPRYFPRWCGYSVGPVWQIYHQIGSGDPSGLGRRATKQWIWIQNGSGSKMIQISHPNRVNIW